jgi:hypothetical protein
MYTFMLVWEKGRDLERHQGERKGPERHQGAKDCLIFSSSLHLSVWLRNEIILCYIRLLS